MFFCPYCGTKVKSEESFCLNCGKKLPNNLAKRMDMSQQGFNRFWLLPIGLVLLSFVVFTMLFFLSERNTAQALKYYEESEELVLDAKYNLASEKLEQAIKLKPKFEQAVIALDFIKVASKIKKNIEQAHDYVDEGEFKDALSLIDESERDLSSYHGEIATRLVENLTEEQNIIKYASLLSSLESQPSIDDLKILIWEAEGIKTKEAEKVAENIRTQIADYTHSKAIELLNKHQFSDAHLLVTDGLKYAAN